MIKKLLVFLLFTELLGLFFYWPFYTNNTYRISFIDIGQGDATLIQTPQNCNILVDGGNPHALIDTIRSFIPSTHNQIHLMIATHPDIDHYGGLQQVAERYQVHNTFIANHPKINHPYKNFLQTLQKSGSTIKTHTNYTRYSLCGIIIDIFPIYAESSNGSSVISLFTLPDNTKILLAGDIEKEEERKFIQSYPDIQADILKANHHGSKTSNTISFLEAINPSKIVISAKKDNRFGHPHYQTLLNIRSLGIQIFRTDLQGTISFSSNQSSSSTRSSK